MRTPPSGGPKPALPGSGSGSAAGTRESSSDEYPPIRWEEIVLGAAPAPSGEGTAPAADPALESLFKSGKPVLLHVYKPDEAATNLRIDRILKGEPQFQDSLDKRFFTAGFVRKAAAFFRNVRVNGTKTDPSALKNLGVVRVPTVILFDAHGERKYVLGNADDTGAAAFAGEMDAILQTLGDGYCCFNHRDEKRSGYYRALYDQAEKEFQSKDYAPAYLKFHEIEMEGAGGKTATIFQKAEQRQGDIVRIWHKDAKEKKRCQELEKLFSDSVAALKAKKFKQAREGFEAVVGANQKRGDMHPGMESERILKELALLDGGGG